MHSHHVCRHLSRGSAESGRRGGSGGWRRMVKSVHSPQVVRGRGIHQGGPGRKVWRRALPAVGVAHHGLGYTDDAPEMDLSSRCSTGGLHADEFGLLRRTCSSTNLGRPTSMTVTG
jgi:hypothetical protein